MFRRRAQIMCIKGDARLKQGYKLRKPRRRHGFHPGAMRTLVGEYRVHEASMQQDMEARCNERLWLCEYLLEEHVLWMVKENLCRDLS